MSEAMGELNNSITKGKGNIIGFLGEIIVAELFKYSFKKYIWLRFSI